MVSLCSYGTAALSVLWYMYVNTYNTYNMYVCTYVPCVFQYINAPSYQLMT